MAGNVPFNVLVFATMYLEARQFSPMQVATIWGVYWVMVGVGCLIWGIIGDMAELYSEDKGRIMIAQISLVAGMVFSAMIFKVLSSTYTDA